MQVANADVRCLERQYGTETCCTTMKEKRIGTRLQQQGVKAQSCFESLQIVFVLCLTSLVKLDQALA